MSKQYPRSGDDIYWPQLMPAQWDFEYLTVIGFVWSWNVKASVYNPHVTASTPSRVFVLLSLESSNITIQLSAEPMKLKQNTNPVALNTVFTWPIACTWIMSEHHRGERFGMETFSRWQLCVGDQQIAAIHAHKSRIVHCAASHFQLCGSFDIAVTNTGQQEEKLKLKELKYVQGFGLSLRVVSCHSQTKSACLHCKFSTSWLNISDWAIKAVVA